MDDAKDQPSTSKQALNIGDEKGRENDDYKTPHNAGGDKASNTGDDNFTLNIKDEEAEIARLNLPSVDKKEETSAVEEDDRIAKIEFQCSTCDMNEMVHYFGKTPPFVYGIKFLEDTFVMRDPFQPPPPRRKPKAEYFIAIGANCVQCQRCVCKDAECSFFYTRTFCLGCAEKLLGSFPIEVRVKLRKQLVAAK